MRPREQDEAALVARSEHLQVDQGLPTRVELQLGPDAPGQYGARLGTGSEQRVLRVDLLRGGERAVLLVHGRVVTLFSKGTRRERQVSWGGVVYNIGPAEPAIPGQSARPPTLSAGVVAPMPGRVVQVLVAPGDWVERGAPLLVVEAMKMQNAISSPSAGRVARLLAVEGQPVERGALLLDFEGAG